MGPVFSNRKNDVEHKQVVQKQDQLTITRGNNNIITTGLPHYLLPPTKHQTLTARFRCGSEEKENQYKGQKKRLNYVEYMEKKNKYIKYALREEKTKTTI